MVKIKIVSVIPIKMNNERLPGKNTKELGGRPLIHYVQQNLLCNDLINERYVYCSDSTICNYLLPGVDFLKRPKFLDEPSSNFNQIFDLFSSEISADIYVYAHATAPFIKESTTRECIEKVISGEFDSAFCAIKVQDYLWKNGEALNFDATNVPRSQDLVPIYRETSGVYVFTKDSYEKTHRRIGEKPFIKEVGYKEAVDINNPEDFELADALFDVRI